ncbi:fumarylacetoacetate hydrolase family protein [Rhodococcus sp. WS4]|nr:fumarylacetoacetate hydrolase family protein [Rhodococcus sp. WS4]
MKFANQSGRFVVLHPGGGVVDVETASKGAFGPAPTDVFPVWREFTQWLASASLSPTGPLVTEQLDAPSPRPPQVFGVGLNYSSHVDEGGFSLPDSPLTFTKFPSSVTGPTGDITITGPQVDWEVELVVVIGETVNAVKAENAWDVVAGVTLGQDISDREAQNRPKQFPQFSLGKSRPGFSPIGPFLVTPDELADRDNIELACSVNGEQVQKGHTQSLIFSVAALIEYLSGLVTLLPGDLIFTGTPPGVGATMDPPRFLADGDILVSTSPELGQMRHRFVAP